VAEGQAVYGYCHEGYWMDVGVPERYLQAHWDLLNGVLGYRWLCSLAPGSRAVLGHRLVGDGPAQATLIPPVVMGPGVELAPGVCVGPYVVLGAGCQVGSGAVIRESVVWEKVRIAAGARICRSILGREVCVREASVLSNVIRIDTSGIINSATITH
jgi:NDP-sugar pyrophosphorylase family protein